MNQEFAIVARPHIAGKSQDPYLVHRLEYHAYHNSYNFWEEIAKNRGTANSGGDSMRGELKEKRKSNITIAVDDTILNEVKKDAKNHGVSVNAEVNNILHKHTVFYRHVNEQDGIILPHAVFAEIVNLIDEDKLMHLPYEKGGGDYIMAIFAHNNISYTIDNLIKYLFESIALWAGTYKTFRYRKDGSGEIDLLFEHEYGIKWSKTVGYSFSRLIQSATGCTAIFKASANTVTVKVNCPSGIVSVEQTKKGKKAVD